MIAALTLQKVETTSPAYDDRCPLATVDAG